MTVDFETDAQKASGSAPKTLTQEQKKHQIIISMVAIGCIILSLSIMYTLIFGNRSPQPQDEEEFLKTIVIPINR